MFQSLSKPLFFLLLCSFFFNGCYSLRKTINKKLANPVVLPQTDQENQEKYFTIPLKKLEISDAHKKKFYDFISESQSDLYTNFLIKSTQIDSFANIKKISLINFQNIQVKETKFLFFNFSESSWEI